MISRLVLYFLLAIYEVFHGVYAEDLPCAQRVMEYGTVCVCNSTYCDTVERPAALPQDQYYIYVTGELSPGFTRSSGTFQSSVSKSSGIVFTVDSSMKYQEIMGFGGSFTDSVGVVLSSLPEEAQDKFYESYFSNKGLEYNAGRVIIGSSDFSKRVYNYDDSSDDLNLANFSLQQEDFLYEIPLIKQAMELSPYNIRLIGSTFSPPPWMKTNGKYASGFIKKQYLDVWAKYHIKFLDAYADNGINFWLITEGNEGALEYAITSSLPIGNLGWPATDRYFLKHHLGPQLRGSNHSQVKYAPLDDMRPFAKIWMKRFTSDPEVSEMVAGVALHWYWDWFYSNTELDDLHLAHPDKLILYTETSINTMLFGGESVMLGSWERATYYFFNIIDNFNHWANAYIDWNLALNVEGGPYITIPLDAPIMVNSTSGEFYKNPMFYAMGTFSKFMPPGAYRVNVTSNLNVSEATVQDRERLRRYLQQNQRGERINYGEGTTQQPLPTFPPLPSPTIPTTIHCLATVNPDNSTTVVLFNTMDEEATVTVVDSTVGSIVSTIPAQTVHTFLYWPKQ